MIFDTAIVATAALVGTVIVCTAALKGWKDWLELKASELERRETGSPHGMARIEISDLKERIRKLEAIAAGVDL